MNTINRLIIAAAFSLLCSACATTARKGSPGTISMTATEATAELYAWGAWSKANPVKEGILASPFTDKHWTIESDGITESGVRTVPVNPNAPPGYRWVFKKGYSEKILFRDVNSIHYGIDYIYLRARRSDGALDSIMIPSNGRPSKTLISALMTVCPNVQ